MAMSIPTSQEPDLLAQALKKARRISRDEIIEANIRMFEDMGLDLEDVETMAESVGRDVGVFRVGDLDSFLDENLQLTGDEILRGKSARR